MLNHWHAQEREATLHQLGADPHRGLEPGESTRRLREQGPNELRETAGARRHGRLAAVPVGGTVPLLAAAAGGAACLQAWGLAAAAGAVAALEVALGRTLAGTGAARPALRGLVPGSARVVRGGRTFIVPAAELVPGDVAELAEGERVPADLRLLAAEQLFAEESALTGEPLPVAKDPALVLPEGAPLAERANMLFAGTLVAGGRGRGVVVATGMRTELGGIARLLGEGGRGPAPLRRRLAGLGRGVVAGTLAAGGLVLAASRLRGEPSEAAALAAASLAVAAAPVALVAAVTVGLAQATRRLARAGCLVREPLALAALGDAAVLCVERTGTLTRNEMTVRELHLEGERLAVTGEGYAPVGAILRAGRPADAAAWATLGMALRTAAHCSAARLRRGAGDDAWAAEGAPLDAALLVLAAKGGVWREDLEAAGATVAAFPRSAERPRTTVVVTVPGRERPSAHAAGDPADVLGHCLHHRTPAGVRPLSPVDRARVLRAAEDLAGRGLTVVGLACREDVAGVDRARVERAMVWLGLAGLADPPRDGAAEAIAACRAAGVRPVLFSGDAPPAAVGGAREIGAFGPGDEVLGGEELEGLTPEALAATVDRYRVFARVTPEHKVRVVEAWRRRGQIVAMVGAGASDAPAVGTADVGVALGGAAGGEGADLVLAGGGLEGVVAALAQGRGLADNVRRSAGRVLAGSLGAALAVLAGALLGWPLPLPPLALLWTGLVAVGLPAAAYGFDEPDAAAMRAPAPPPGGGVLRARARPGVIVEGAAVAAASLAAFLLAWRGGEGAVASARTQAFAVLALAQLPLALAALRRTGAGPARDLRAGGAVLGAVALAGALVAAAVPPGPLAGAFGTVALAREEWLRVAALAAAPLVAALLARGATRGRG